LVERQSHNLKVASSILAGSNPYLFGQPWGSIVNRKMDFMRRWSGIE
jgi:hypothetical protein